MRQYILLIIGAIGLGLFACNNTPEGYRDIEDFYYPVDDLRKGLVYEYQSPIDSLDPPFYWYYRTFYRGDSTFLTGMYYNFEYQPNQFIREHIVDGGSKLVDFKLYETDTTGRQYEVPVNIDANNVFPFLVAPQPGVLLMKMSWTDPYDSLTTVTLIRNRQYAADTTFTFQGKTYDSVRFNVRELVDIDRVGHTEQEYPVTEIYAKGLGLVFYRKEITADYIVSYQLADRYDMGTFEKKFGRALENKEVLPEGMGN